jgi:hypothetical protein
MNWELPESGDEELLVHRASKTPADTGEVKHCSNGVSQT